MPCNALLHRPSNVDPKFDNQVKCVCVAFIPDFGIGALVVLKWLTGKPALTAHIAVKAPPPVIAPLDVYSWTGPASHVALA
jgi:hypothetical protein